MFGQIVRITAVSGKRAALAASLLASAKEMPGCLSYVVAEDADADSLWITEIWRDEATHRDSPEIKSMIEAARPLIAGFDKPIRTRALGGIGLSGK